MGAGGGASESPHVYPNVPFNNFRKIKFNRLTDTLQHRC